MAREYKCQICGFTEIVSEKTATYRRYTKIKCVAGDDCNGYMKRIKKDYNFAEVKIALTQKQIKTLKRIASLEKRTITSVVVEALEKYGIRF